MYAACKRLFSSLPLAARIGEATLVLHGGLFRRQPQRGGAQGKNKRKRALPLLHGEQGGGRAGSHCCCSAAIGTHAGLPPLLNPLVRSLAHSHCCALPRCDVHPAGLEDVTLGTLEDLRRAGKGGMDPNGLGAARLASDVLWSDPVGAVWREAAGGGARA